MAVKCNPALVHDGDCGCPDGTPVVLSILRDRFRCCRCLMEVRRPVRVELVAWPIEIHLGADVAISLKHEYCNRSSETQAIAAEIGVGDRVELVESHFSRIVRRVE